MTSDKKVAGEDGGRHSIRGRVELSTAVVGFATAVVSLIVAFHSNGNAQTATSKAQTAQQQLDQANTRIQVLQSQLAQAQATPTVSAAGGSGTGGGGGTPTAAPDFVRNLTMPGPSPLPDENAIDVSQGRIILDGVGVAALIYKQRTAGSYELDANTAEGSSAAVLAPSDPTPTSAAACAQDVQSEPFSSQRDLPKGLRLCVDSGDGIALLVVTEAPDANGNFSVKETFWKNN